MRKLSVLAFLALFLCAAPLFGQDKNLNSGCECNVLASSFKTDYEDRLSKEGYAKYKEVVLNIDSCLSQSIKLECLNARGSCRAYFYTANYNYSLKNIHVVFESRDGGVVAMNFYKGKTYKAFSFDYKGEVEGVVKLLPVDTQKKHLCVKIDLFRKVVSE
jgi:hypothetical protein